MDAYASHREPRAIWGLQEGKYKITHLVSQQPGRDSGMWSGAEERRIVMGDIELDIVTLY